MVRPAKKTTDMFKTRTIIAILLTAAGLALSAQTLTLDSCKALALRNNLTLKNAALDVAAAQEVKKQAFTKYFPNVSAIAGGYYAAKPLFEYSIDNIENASARQFLHNLYYEYGAAMGLPDRISLCENGLMVGATVVQPVYMGGQIVNGNKLAKVGIEAAELKAQLTEEQILQQVEEYYWLIISLQEKLRTLQQAMTFLDTLQRDVNTASEAGLVSKNDPLKVKLKWYEVYFNREKVQNGIQLATDALRLMIGQDDGVLILTDTIGEISEWQARWSDPGAAVLGRKEKQLLDMQVSAEELKKKMTLGETLPHLMIGGTASYGNLIFDHYSANALAFATLQVPLTGWWEASHKLKQHDILIQKAENERPKQWRLYVSAELTLRHLNQLRLLGSIEQKVRSLNSEANRFLLSDTQGLLNRLIDHSDSPFIFEKSGTQLTHIMIDEFQDTSTVQWRNFKVLLEETMSHAHSSPLTVQGNSHSSHPSINNLIVGDVKQSIYRWRSGDWQLLNNIEKQFPLSKEVVQVQPLDTNYRSCRNIIQFNNAFFLEAVNFEYQREADVIPDLAEQLKSAYQEVKQFIPENKPEEGKVDICLLPHDGYDEETLRLVGEQTDSWIAAGVEPGNITILVRKNKYIPLLANYFTTTRPHLGIVSDEAFRLDASLAVNTLVSALRSLVNPQDNISHENVSRAWCFVADEQTLPLTAPREDYLHMPLYNLVERLFRELKLDKLINESGYVCKFFDEVTAFVQDNGADLDGFIKAWDEDICKKTIQSSETDGIRDNVIIPWCDWKLEMTDTLWCESSEAPFNELPLIPVDYSTRLAESIYYDDFAREHLQTCVDNLNLLYVAFTRAKSNLFVIGKRNTSGLRSQLIQECLEPVSNILVGAHLDVPDDASAPITFDYGTLALPHVSKKEKSRNIFLPPIVHHQISITAHEPHVTFRQSNQSRDFIAEMAGEETFVQNDYVKMGNVMHRIFSQIHTTDDIPGLLRKLEREGVLYDESISRKKVESILKSRFQNPIIRHWFSGEWKLFNECSIIAIDTEGKLMKRRPDRVMTNGKEVVVVDFKFGTERDEYHNQVRQYVQLLRSMGYQNVKGFLWFVYSNIIKQVKE